MIKSYSQQMEEQLEPRPDGCDCQSRPHHQQCASMRFISPEKTTWDHSDTHEQIHEQTQD